MCKFPWFVKNFTVTFLRILFTRLKFHQSVQHNRCCSQDPVCGKFSFFYLLFLLIFSQFWKKLSQRSLTSLTSCQLSAYGVFRFFKHCMPFFQHSLPFLNIPCFCLTFTFFCPRPDILSTTALFWGRLLIARAFNPFCHIAFSFSNFPLDFPRFWSFPWIRSGLCQTFVLDLLARYFHFSFQFFYFHRMLLSAAEDIKPAAAAAAPSEASESRQEKDLVSR